MTNLGFETETIEYKKSTSELIKGVESLVSMLNKHGEGILYFGVKPNGDVIGQKDITESTLRDISRKISEGIKPQVIPTISIDLIEDKTVIKVTVKGINAPYSAFGKFFLRSFDEDKQVEPHLIKKLVNNYSGEPDLIVNIEASRDNLTFKLLKGLYLINGYEINEDNFNENAKLYTKDKKFNYMAELLADENDISIKVVTFKGADKTIMLKRTEYGGKCLLYAMKDVENYMESINETKVKIDGLVRKEEKFFDIDAFKEAWVNACAHNRWIEKIPPAVYIYDDRIEIISNGGLPKSLSKEDFFRGVSKPVNTELMDILLRFRMMDQTGHGIPLIVKKYGRDAFYISEHTIIVTIPINKNPIEDSKVTEYNILNDNEEKVYNILKKSPYITIDELSKRLKVTDRYIDKIIKKLKDDLYIERVGSNKKGYWKVIR